ncbi:MAG: response regulator transcription factor [Paludibacter sp.]|nr:response regulator transcription factor [Paludibacter sp.]MDD4198043.1 response regulator transcription factor [Paludibacter sp.]MDD4427018.1 response regulator transcription factor [Paludibacter sp.]
MREIIIADNQDLTCAGWIYLINKSGVEAQIFEVHHKKELITLCAQFPEALIILDYALSDFERVQELIFLQEKYPKTNWIVSSEELSRDSIRTLLVNSGKFSILLKDSPAEDFISALKQAIRGERYISSFITNMLLETSKPKPPTQARNILTTTEQEILKEMALGKSTREIAALRHASMHTIMTHRKNIFRKIEVNNVHEATKYAMKAGLIDLAEYYI